MSGMQSGGWYYAIECGGCETPISIGLDHTNGTGNEIQWPNTNIRLVCPVCGKQENRQAVEARRYQAP
jgi:predicted RNA-binding Zn-ribbon protein involved in translation (DUF1610 family)